MAKVKRTERGWAGHFCASSMCLFRRNTLLEYKDIRVVVSTVGLMRDILDESKFTMIGGNSRYYETMAFYAHWVADRYWDADVSREFDFESPWCINEVDADDRANDMHEQVVKEIKANLKG